MSGHLLLLLALGEGLRLAVVLGKFGVGSGGFHPTQHVGAVRHHDVLLRMVRIYLLKLV